LKLWKPYRAHVQQGDQGTDKSVDMSAAILRDLIILIVTPHPMP
jgi:hypothetical protein